MTERNNNNNNSETKQQNDIVPIQDVSSNTENINIKDSKNYEGDSNNNDNNDRMKYDNDHNKDYESFRKAKRNLGRSARRRRKKLLEVEAAATAAVDGDIDGGNNCNYYDDTTEINNNNNNNENNKFNQESKTRMKKLLPTDRAHLLPAVQKLRQLQSSDEEALIRQLGYLPGNALEVAARTSAVPRLCTSSNSSNVPIVLKLYPVVLREETKDKSAKGRHKARRRKRRHNNQQQSSDDQNCIIKDNTTAYDENDNNAQKDLDVDDQLVEPFPTIYWVTHPRLRALISKLEDLERLGVTFERKLNDPNECESLEKMRKAHLQYGEERQALLTSDDWKWICQRKWENAFSTTRGVAGIRNPASIKCLHAHAAHYWSGCQYNLVGKWVAERVTEMLSSYSSSSGGGGGGGGGGGEQQQKLPAGLTDNSSQKLKQKI